MRTRRTSSSVAGTAPRGLELAGEGRRLLGGAKDANTGLSGDGHGGDGGIVPGGVGVSFARARRTIAERGGTFQADGGGLRGDVLEFHLVGDDVALDVQLDLFAELGLGIDQEMIVEAEEIQVGLDAALRD